MLSPDGILWPPPPNFSATLATLISPFERKTDAVLSGPDLAHIDRRDDIARGERDIYKAVVIAIDRARAFASSPAFAAAWRPVPKRRA